jgi:hypothetical protein
MRITKTAVLALAVAFYCTPVFAQHGHGAGGTTHGAPDHGSLAGKSSSHRMTMDEQLSRNKQLSSKIQTLTGMNAQTACSGFKNLGQCVAAAHVSKNLGIKFGCLKYDMTGVAPAAGTSCPTTTASSSQGKMSLGQAIQTLSPTANSNLEAKKGKKQADQDLKQSTSNS